MKRMQQQKVENIKSYLERDVMMRQAARYAMFKAEEDFKASSREYDRIDTELQDHLLDLGDAMGFDPPTLEPMSSEQIPQGFAQFEET